MEINKIYNENCLDTMIKMPDNFIDLTITSPPYDNLRNYKEYIFCHEIICKELFRITKNNGVIVWIVGDETIDGSETGTSFKQALYFKEIGFNLHDTMIYEKAGMSMPSNNRYHQIFEYMFILSKGKPKTFNGLKDRPNRWRSSFGKSSHRQKNGELQKKEIIKFGEFGLRFNIWRYANGAGYGQREKEAYLHPATFPEDLCNDHILTWSNENDLIYDCFMGSGTTAKMAFLNNRKFIGSEISKEYTDMAIKRIAFLQAQKRLFEP